MSNTTVLHAKWVITCEDNNHVLTDYALIIKDQRICDILPSQSARQRYPDALQQTFATHALLPGLINAHTHAAMNVFRGLADDLELMDWLQNHIWPAEGKWVSEEMVRDGSELAMAEMLRSGTTCFNDMYFFPEITAQCVDKVGMRSHLGMTIINIETAWAKTPEEYFEKSLNFYEQYKHHPRITPTFAPQGAYTVKANYLEKIKTLADQYQLRINIHCQESKLDIEGSIKLNKKRPLQCLHDIGLLNSQLIAIHMVVLDDNDLNLIQQCQPNIVHCPESNLKLASGISPVAKLLDLGANVALGTDGAASNNDLDMLGEMRTAALIGKVLTHDPKALSAETVLKMATLHGAKALGIEQHVGSLTIGKQADVIAINLETLETQPLFHPLSQIVYATTRDQVTDVWVAGRQLLKHRQLQTLDSDELLVKAKRWQKRLHDLR